MSNAIHGKFAIIYVSPGTGEAVPIGEQLDWSIDFNQPLVDVSPLNSTWQSFVKGIAGWLATFNGNFDFTNNVLWNAALADTKVKFYLYPLGANFMGQYYYGSGWATFTKLIAGSTTTKASSGFKVQGDGVLTAR